MFSFQGISLRDGKNRSDEVGVDWGVGPPVPIPNTEVKHTFADDTCWVTDWENR